jgi:hypothetical protein
MRDIGHRASSSHDAGVNDEDEDEDFDNGTDDAAKATMGESSILF